MKKDKIVVKCSSVNVKASKRDGELTVTLQLNKPQHLVFENVCVDFLESMGYKLEEPKLPF